MTGGLKLDSRRQRTEASDAAYRDFLENQKGKHGAIYGIKDVFDAWQASEFAVIRQHQQASGDAHECRYKHALDNAHEVFVAECDQMQKRIAMVYNREDNP